MKPELKQTKIVIITQDYSDAAPESHQVRPESLKAFNLLC